MAAEIAKIKGLLADVSLASMRPRRMAAEIPPRRPSSRSSTAGFNEAAANGRGNPTRAQNGCLRAVDASMRPRRMAAEIAAGSRARTACSGRFNEAAANGRGNPASARRTGPSRRCFNEAAANGRGNPDAVIDTGTTVYFASMRPRRMAAEIVGGECRAPGRDRASMRPRRMAAEIAARAPLTPPPPVLQ